jgi:hypothetical protein
MKESFISKTKINFESNLKKMLNIDDSIQISDNNDINNEIKNTIDSTNFSSCKINANAENIIAANNINVQNDINIAYNRQKSTAELNEYAGSFKGVLIAFKFNSLN